MSVAVLWRDGHVTHGVDATDVLLKLCGGWNPNTVIELREVLARRAGVVLTPQAFDDEQFLQQLDAAGALTYQHVQDPK